MVMEKSKVASDKLPPFHVVVFCSDVVFNCELGKQCFILE